MKKIYSRPATRTIHLNMQNNILATSIPVAKDPNKEIDTNTGQLSNEYRGVWDSSNWE